MREKSQTKGAKCLFPVVRGDSYSLAHGQAVDGGQVPGEPEPWPEATHFTGDAAASASFRPVPSPHASLQQGRLGVPAGIARATEAGQWGAHREAGGGRAPPESPPAPPRGEAGQEWLRGDLEARGRGRQTVPLVHRSCGITLGATWEAPAVSLSWNGQREGGRAVSDKAKDAAAWMPEHAAPGASHGPAAAASRAVTWKILPKCLVFALAQLWGGARRHRDRGEPPRISTPPASRGCAMWQGGRASQDGQWPRQGSLSTATKPSH